MAKPAMYKTRQREAILSFIETNKENLITARAIYDNFLNRNNPIGMATIYRRLEELTDQGLLSKHTIEGISGPATGIKAAKKRKARPPYVRGLRKPDRSGMRFY